MSAEPVTAGPTTREPAPAGAVAPDRRRLWAAVLLAFSLGATVVGWRVASANFAIADREANPRIDEVFGSIQGDESRTMAVRYLMSESNRALFEFGGPVQLLVVVAAFALYWWSPGRRRERVRRWLFLFVLLASAASVCSIPWFVEAGREIDFVSRSGGRPPEVKQFLMLHGVYMGVDLLRVIASALLVPLLMVGARRRDVATPAR